MQEIEKTKIRSTNYFSDIRMKEELTISETEIHA